MIIVVFAIVLDLDKNRVSFSVAVISFILIVLKNKYKSNGMVLVSYLTTYNVRLVSNRLIPTTTSLSKQYWTKKKS